MTGAETLLVIDKSLADTGITMVSANSPEGLRKTRSLLSSEALQKAQPFLPYSAVLTNTTDQYVWGFGIVFRYLDRIAPSGDPSSHVVFRSVGGSAGVRTQMLTPGSSYFVSPVSGFHALADKDGTRHVEPLLHKDLDRLISFFREDLQGSRVEIALDSVIFEDGMLVGPDSSDQMANINTRIRAERELAQSIVTRTGEDLRKTLRFYAGPTTGDEYVTHKASIATWMLAVLEQDGESGLLENARKMSIARWFANAEFVRRKQ